MAFELTDGSREVTAASSTVKEQAVEVAVFLFLIMPSMILSLFVVRQGALSFELTAVATILRDLGLVSLILFFLWRNGENVERIGWSLRRVGGEAALGVALFIPFVFGAALLERGLLRAGLSRPATPLPSFLEARGGSEFLLASVLVGVVALAEETLFRGYLILRFQALLRSSAWAVLLSSAIFSVGHGYEGSAGLVTGCNVFPPILAGSEWRERLPALKRPNPTRRDRRWERLTQVRFFPRGLQQIRIVTTSVRRDNGLSVAA